MKHSFIRFLLAIFLVVALADCAKRGTITGGDKDITPPVLLKAEPDTSTISFKSKEIRLYFNELVKLNNIQKQLIVSPPMNTAPTVSPNGSAAKMVKITINDTLKENTTYVLNFGQSIGDYNENNPYSYFKYVFSTGDYIDSLTLNGSIRDAFNKTADNFVTIMLYPFDENYTDSLVYKEKPLYVTNTLDSLTSFEITNIKAGTYKLFALKDVGNNFVFNQKIDKIAFYEKPITIPADSGAAYPLTLFQEVPNYRATKPVLAAKNRVIFGFEGDTTDVAIEMLSDKPEDFRRKILADQKADTLNYWFTPFEADSLLFKVTKGTQIDTFTVKTKELYADSLSVEAVTKGVLHPGNKFRVKANTPIDSIHEDFISIINQDSTQVAFKANLLKATNELELDFNTFENRTYSITMLPNSIKDLFGKTNDTLNYQVKTNKYSEYGTIIVKLVNPETFPLLVQLTDSKGTVMEERFAATNQTTFYFNNISPATYLMRVIYDTNGNKKWDTGNYLQGIQPEQIYYYPDPIELRANWEFEQQFILN